jgi:hypothetical protein
MTSRIIGANVIQTGCCGWPDGGVPAWASIPFKSIKCINSKAVGHFRQLNENGKRFGGCFGICALESPRFGNMERIGGKKYNFDRIQRVECHRRGMFVVCCNDKCLPDPFSRGIIWKRTEYAAPPGLGILMKSSGRKDFAPNGAPQR